MKTKAQQIVLVLIFVVVYDVSVHMFVNNPTSSQWISLAFIHAAYAILLISMLTMPKGKHGAVLGFAGTALATQFFGLELGLGTIYLIVGDASVTWTLIPQMVLAGVYVALMIMTSLANQRIVVDSARDEGHVDYVRQTVAALQRIRLGVTDTGMSKRLDAVEDALRYAQVASNPSVAGLEADMFTLLDRLESAVRSGDISVAIELCDSIETLVALRDTNLSNRRR